MTTTAASNVAHLRILSINDFHGQLGDSEAKVGSVDIGSAATLSAYIQRERAANPTGTALVAAGDLMGAAPPASSLLHNKPAMAVLAAMGVDVATLGNHEFDGGFGNTIKMIFGDGPKADAALGAQIAATPGLAAKKKIKNGAKLGAGVVRWPGSAFPWVSSNVVDSKTKQTILPPYAIKMLNGVKVAFVGADTADLKNVTTSAGIPNIEATDPAKAINALVPQLKAQGVQSIIVMIHEGGSPDPKAADGVTGAIVDIAKRLDPAVNAIVSAHTHKEYVATIAGKTVIEAGSYASALGEIDLDVDRTTGKVTTKDARLIHNDQSGILPDPVVGNMVKAFEAKVAPRTSKVVTTLAGPLSNESNAAGETTLGAVIADAQRTFAKADVGLMNVGGIRTSVKAGSVNWGQLFSVQPFGNRVDRIELTGAQLREVLEQQFTAARTNILQTSGLTTHVDLTKPIGSRVVSVTMADGTPLDPKKTYTVAANGFLCDGGDGYTKLKAGTKRTDLGDDLSALVAFLAANGAKISTKAPGRIIIDKGTLPADMG